MISTENRLQRGLTLPGSEDAQLQATRMEVSRLVVLVPDHDTYGIELARRVWALAEPCELGVLFLCVPGTGATQESATLLRLITLASQVRSEKIQVDTCIERNVSWSAAVSRHWQPGDLVLCCAEQTVQTRGRGMQPLWQVLEFALGTPVFVLTGLYGDQITQPARATANPLGSYARWLIPLLMIGIFFFAQAQLDGLTTGLTHTLALVTLALVELTLLTLWALGT